MLSRLAHSARIAWLGLCLALVLPQGADAGRRYTGPALRRAPVLTKAQAATFTRQLIARERRFFTAGVAYDAETGMSFDGHALDTRTGKLVGKPRGWSAASKESLHLILLVKAIEGDPDAQALLTPDPREPSRAVGAALEVLKRKIATYRRFDEEHPGYGGFLPWYKIEHGKMSPTVDWADRVPSLDNGQLAWSIYRAVDALERSGHGELAAQYRAQLALMKKNVVDLFYDPDTKKMRAETKLVGGSGKPPALNTYANNQPLHFLDDAYEGEMLCHFADLFGDWQHHPTGKDAIWSKQRRSPASYSSGDKKITVVKGNWFSAHEDWGFMVLPLRDIPVADRLFKNAQIARTRYSSEHGLAGLFASTSQPSKIGGDDAGYLSALGIPGLGKEKVSRKKVFAPYASFPLALSDRPMFATWLKRMVETPGMLTEYGMGESYTAGGRKIAPVLTWDGKALPLIAWMGGIGPEIGAQMKRDGVYDAFVARVKTDYGAFRHLKIEGARLHLAAPPAP